jgi:hypothetical protein
MDAVTNQLWAGDVGQNRQEEVDLIASGDNLGWPVMEGFECFNKNDRFNPLPSCDQSGLTLPIVDYGRSEGNSITGGYIYRGMRQPDLNGAYIYGDFGSGNIWKLTYQDGETVSNEFLVSSGFPISSFGVDEENELYILNYSGSIYRFVNDIATSASAPENVINTFVMHQNYPNPFNPDTRISFSLHRDLEIKLAIYDITGRQVALLAYGAFPAGNHEIDWNGLDESGNPVASGIYYYRLQTDRFVETRKMLLLR